MEQKHTPGPWVCDVRTGCFAIYTGSERNCLAGASQDAIVYQAGRGNESSPGGYHLITQEQEANARLIAAAPELYTALKEAENWLSEYETGPDTGLHGLLEQIRNALKKVEESQWTQSS